jgi:hypothetical protein
VPSLRRPPRTLASIATSIGAWIAALVVLGQVSPAIGQAFDPYLMRPRLDGDPRNPPRFSRTSVAELGDGRQGLRFWLPRGKGKTGFDPTPPRRPKAQPGRRPLQSAAAAAESANGPPALPTQRVQSAHSLAENPKQGLRQNPTQQSHAANGANAPYPVGPLGDPPALPARRRLLPDQDSFAPIGIDAGSFLLRPAVEMIGGYDSNSARSATGKASWYAVLAPELLVNSNWSRHEVSANLRGSYTDYENASDLNRPSLDAKVNGRIDVTPFTRIDLEGRAIVGTDNPGSPNIQAGLARLPIYTTVGGSAGLGQRFNRVEVTLKGGIDRTAYQQSTFTDGTTASNADRDFDRYFGELRASYELTPGVKPFVETGTDRRVHDLAIDRTGVRRDSDGHYVKAGTTFELERTLTGDIALGYVERSYEDPTLPKISGPTFDASLTWLASALTAAKLTARTTVDETLLSGVSGAFTREVALEIDHAFRRWLVATLKVNAATVDYVGSPRADERYATAAFITYKLTREVWLKGEYRHEWRHSNVAGNDYQADVVLVGARLQR